MEEDRYTRITLRIPKDLHAQLQQAADDTSKSMNAEIVARLQASFALSGEAPTLKSMQRMPETEPWQAEIRAEYAKLSLQNRLMTLVTRQNQANFALMQTAALIAELKQKPARQSELKLAEQMHREALQERELVDLSRRFIENELQALGLQSENSNPFPSAPGAEQSPSKQAGPRVKRAAIK